MSARNAAITGMIVFILLLSFGSYLLDVPMTVVLIAAAFAISVILWLGSRFGPTDRR